MSRLMLTTATVVVLLLGAGPPAANAAQSAVREVPPAATPYVPLYSICRAVPPPDPVAQAIFKSMRASQDFADYRSQLEALRAKPVDSLTAAEAEAYFLLLAELVFRTGTDLVSVKARGTLVLEDRRHGGQILDRFREDDFVRCAFLASEASILNGLGLRERFSEQARRSARDSMTAFIERALRGEVRTDTPRYVLESAVGQRYLDVGFDRLPNTAAAAPLFERGARHVLDAASTMEDDRLIANWTRYAFMLEKLPREQRLAIAQRLLTHLEQTWGGASASTGTALRAYLHLLDFAGETALDASRGKDAVSIFTRHLEIVQQLRQRSPGDPNHQVSEALGYLLLGDAHRLDGNRPAAAEAYRNARRVFNGSSGSAKEMLEFQEFSEAIDSRLPNVR